jgi:Holliday junction DNA helicase RuvB
MPFEADNGEMEIITIDLPTFTIVGATTELGSLVSPFRDRFKLKFSLETYSKETLYKILEANANKLNINISEKSLDILANASRGTPRIANSLLEWIRDYSIAKDISKVTETITKDALNMRDGTVGVSTISSSINIDRDTIESVIEPFLLSHNKISKTPRGRIAL